MLKIKKYANGRFFDTINKKYIKPEQLAEMIKKGQQLKVTLTQTGKDITQNVVEQFSKKEDTKKEKKVKEDKTKDIPFLKTDKLVKWMGDVIDEKIKKILDIVKLPSREQLAKLDESIKELNKKIDALKLNQELNEVPAKKKVTKKKAAPQKQTQKKAAAAPKEKSTKIEPAPEPEIKEERPTKEEEAKTVKE